MIHPHSPDHNNRKRCGWCGDRPCDGTSLFHAFLQRHDLHPECWSSAPDEWLTFLDLLVIDLKQMGWSGKVTQIKSKFGHLRFYAEDTTDAMDERIRLTAAQIRKATNEGTS